MYDQKIEVEKQKGRPGTKPTHKIHAAKRLYACCGRATDLILSFRVATRRGKMITYKIQSVHRTKINQEKHSYFW